MARVPPTVQESPSSGHVARLRERPQLAQHTKPRRRVLATLVFNDPPCAFDVAEDVLVAYCPCVAKRVFANTPAKTASSDQ